MFVQNSLKNNEIFSFLSIYTNFHYVNFLIVYLISQWKSCTQIINLLKTISLPYLIKNKKAICELC